MNTITSIIEKINNAKQLDFGSIFGEAIELYKKTWVQGFLLQIFTLVIMLPLILVLYVPLIGLMVAQQESGYNDQEALNTFIGGMSVFYVLFVIIGICVLGTISMALQASFFRIIKRMDHDEAVTTSDFFHFIKGKYLSKVFVLMLIAIGIAIPSALLCYIPLLYTMVPISFFTLIFAYNAEFSTGEIVKASFKIGNKKWGITLALFLVSYLCIMVLSMITCGLGSLFLQAFLLHPIYLVYKKVVGFDETTDAIEEIGTSIE
ncbi:hypothetical protein ACFFU1_18380 [Algibacter miyuki]|uniref:Glycerophosphoryl diester phosphodiesterase membrane domain-containing protein n=1 Tax=Algibacter miyuki TaxID=1306933 RepID=A0ABV5H4Q3_9FLAO|nr:hypothetical protein [Algibacter miyuki]MDN3665809.1 hypothetical protein [Algibacter miyuki]